MAHSVYRVVWLVLLCSVDFALSADDKCQDQLQKLAACVEFVGGTHKEPTEQCCTNLKEVRATSPRCLCILLKQTAGASSALPVNRTLALEMPAICKVEGKVTDCPAILNIDPNSPEAKIYGTGNSSSTSPSSNVSSSATANPNRSFSLSLRPRIGLNMVTIVSSFMWPLKI